MQLTRVVVCFKSELDLLAQLAEAGLAEIEPVGICCSSPPSSRDGEHRLLKCAKRGQIKTQTKVSWNTPPQVRPAI